MTPIILPIAELKPALVGLGKVISHKATLAVLQHVKIERTSDGWIALTGTDLDRFVTTRFEHPAEGPPLAVLVPYEQLMQVTKNCGKGERIELESTPDGPVIKFPLADRLGESKVKPIPVAEFPATPRIKADSFPLPAALRGAINEAMECASTDQTRYVLNGAFIDTRDAKANYIVGTNGQHLYSANSFAIPLKDSVIIPSHKFLGWKEFNLDGEWQIKADDKQVQISSRRWRFISRHIDGKYPDWRQVLPDPKLARVHITIDPAKLEGLIKLIQRMPCHDEKHRTLGLEWKQGQLLLLGKESGDDPWLRVPVPDVKGNGPEVTIFLDRRYLLKALQFGLNTISLMDPISPLRFHCQGKQMIVMPVRENQPDNQAPAAEHRPRAIPPPAPPQERTPMITPAEPPSPPATNGTKSPVEEAIDMTLQLRDKLNEGFNLLRDLSLKLKTINRDQRTNAREFNTLRSSLRSLQGLKL
jgi:DNA polymerase III sliding clamp (beta) subunit (PCNA family)